MKNISLKSRKEELSNIYRYDGSASVMFYRPNLLIHTKRVAWLTTEICNELEKLGLEFDKNLAIELAKFHDDTEIITGDIVATKKERWIKNEEKEYNEKCENAKNILYNNYKNLSKKYDYKYLLELEEERNSIEFFIIKYADRLDAHLECIHEIYGGNQEFFKRAIKINMGFLKNYKGFIKTPYNREQSTIDFFGFTHARISKDLDNLCKAINMDLDKLRKSSIFNLKTILNIENIFLNSKPHTIENIKQKKEYDLYNIWINLHFKYGEKQEQEELYKIKSSKVAIISGAEIIENNDNGLIHKHNDIIYKNRNKLIYI